MDIIDLANQYNKFQEDVGAELDTHIDQNISKIFSSSFKKLQMDLS